MTPTLVDKPDDEDEARFVIHISSQDRDEMGFFGLENFAHKEEVRPNEAEFHIVEFVASPRTSQW